MVKGEPLFQTEDASKQAEGDTTKPQQVSQPIVPQPITAPQSKPLPYVAITRWEHEYHGDNLQINLTLRNNSQETIELDRLLFLGQENDLDEVLDPGEAREIKAYYGDSLSSGSYTKAELWYKDCDRNAFGSLHTVDFHLNREGKYEVSRFHFLAPVRKYR